MTVAHSESWLLAILVAAGIWLVGWLLMRLALAWLPGLLHRSKTQVDDLLFAAVKAHIPFWFLALGLVVGARRAPIPHDAFTWIDRVVTAAVILSVSLALASFLVRLVRSRAAPGLGLLPTNTLIENAIRVGVLILGAVVVLGEMGVAITPILTALGVGSLAVALALQPTLTNLFAGFHITLARLVRIGDYIELDNGQRGHVVDINWRSTLIRELADNTIILPNSRLAEMIVRNYSLPGEEHGVTVTVTVAYDADLERAQAVALAAAREVQRSAPGAVADGEPGAQYTAFQDSGVQLSVFLRVQTVRDRVRVAHELIKLLPRRFREAGIEIPLPQRVVHFPPTGAAPAAGLPAGPGPTSGPGAPAPPAPRS
jgi:small-conductance mechanosensitive channel